MKVNNLREVLFMLADLMDRRNSFAKKLMRQDKVDPGTFSFMEPGW